MDNTEFNSALRRFINAMSMLPADVTHPGICDAAAELCDLLRISQLTVHLTEPRLGKMRGEPEHHSQVFRSEGTPNTAGSFTINKKTVAGSSVDYVIAPFSGEPGWTDQELLAINDFITTMFVFNGRARAMTICAQLTFSDTELEIYNLNFFMVKLEDIIARNEQTNYTAFRINLKKFSIVNKQLGRRNGTRVMRRYVHGLKELAGEDGIVSRLGGDNFVGLCRHERIDAIKEYLTSTFVPTGIAGIESVNVSARTGYYKIDEDCHTPPDVMDKLSMMFSLLKRNPSLSYMQYDETVSKKAEVQRWVEGLFGSAIENEEFIVYYQPKVNLKNYTLSGAEALCRWKHDGELIPPGRFIPILEQSSNICVLDFYMLEHVCRDLRRWLDQGLPVVAVSVNISRVHLGSENLAAKIINIIKKYDIPNELIEIELTETTTDVDFTELKRVVATLHSVGICTSIDDFGIGYSSLNLIRELPWNVLKIDRSFLPNSEDKNNSQKRIMLKYVIAMAQSLGLECIVEGVETIEHIALLKENNCFRAQGFFFDRPLPVEEFEDRLIAKQVMT